MRRIKFRAWDNINEIMDDDVFIDGDGNAYDYASTTYNTPNTEIQRCDFPIMQFTGLKDKNGVEIYEGDILKTFSNINKYTDSFAEDIEPKFTYTSIVIDGSCFKTTYKRQPSLVLNENSGSKVENMEVVGNIYENKNLLEEK